jgi:polysaccharide export outer membrane protein
MAPSIHQSISWLTLSIWVGVTLPLTSFAQTSPLLKENKLPAATTQQPEQTPLPPREDQFPASPSQKPGLLLPTSPPGKVQTYEKPPTQPDTASLIESAYVLGAGDLIRVEVFETPELILEPRYNILVDGSINLPWVGGVSVQGLTLAEAANELSAKYSRFIRNPTITVSLIAPRPLKIGIIGEVNRPGPYLLNLITSESTQASLGQRSSAESGNQWPTVSRALQAAGGITQLANIRQIQVRRSFRNGRTETISVDLWKFLKDGDLASDILLRDSDMVVVAKVDKDLPPEEATQVAVSNFSPLTIRVNVVGEVERPGPVEIRPNSTLNQAIFAAGGPKNSRARKSRVELIRLNPNGTVTRREINLDYSKGVDEAGNPAVYNNDVIVVNRNTLATVSDVLSAVLSPITGLFGLLSILGINK